MRRRVLIVGAVLLALLLAGTASGVAVLSSRPGPSASASANAAEDAWPKPAVVDWRRCDSAGLRQIGARCAAVKVPLDWSHPRNGRTVTLALARVRHTAAQYAGVILANPGGPGASGLGLAGLGSSVPDGIGARYDWIGFDPRGVGASTPRLSCDADYADGPRPAYTPTEATIAAWRTRAAAYASACGAKYGDLLRHMTTRDTVDDIEYLRIALGEPKISFYGYSYGTYLGEVYATLHPDRVRRMVLDSTVDPRGVWYRANLEQDVAFDVVIRRWFDWIADHDATYRLGSTRAEVERAFAGVSARLARTPADDVYGSAEWEDTVLHAGYSQGLWAPLAEAFSDAALAKDATRAIALWRGLGDADDNGYAVYLAVQCTDAAWPRDWATWESDARDTASGSPYGTWLNTWFNAPCLTWPVPGGTPVEVDGADAPPILMIDQTLDAATPFAGSVEVRSRFPKASLLALPGGTSHAESLNGDTCVDTAVARYLDDGTLPARRTDRSYDAACPAPPLPIP